MRDYFDGIRRLGCRTSGSCKEKVFVRNANDDRITSFPREEGVRKARRRYRKLRRQADKHRLCVHHHAARVIIANQIEKIRQAIKDGHIILCKEPSTWLVRGRNRYRVEVLRIKPYSKFVKVKFPAGTLDDKAVVRDVPYHSLTWIPCY